MKMVYFYNEDWEVEYIQDKLSDVFDVSFIKGCVHETTDTFEGIEVISIFVNSQVGKKELDRFPDLKCIATRSTGFDHIDITEAKKRGIQVMNVPTYGQNTVAEHAFALLLALARKIYDAYDRIVEMGSFSQEGLRGFDLEGKTLGVVGVGNIGRHTVKIAKGFGMQVLGYDRYPDASFAKEFDFEYGSLEDIFSRADIITLHVPYNEHTHHLINRGVLSKLKKGVYIINTARGHVIETQALIEGLKNGIIAGAGLDVFEEEGETMTDDPTKLLMEEHPNAEQLKILLSNQYLIDHPQVIITPHIAFNTKEAMMRIVDTTIQNVRGFIEGKVQNVVD